MNTIVNPKIWGKYYWYTMRSIAATANLFDEATQKNVVNFYESLQTLLPCDECAKHYQNYLQTYPVRRFLKDNKTLLGWVKQLEDHIQAIITSNVTSDRQLDRQQHSRSAQTVQSAPKSLSDMKAEARAFKQHMKIKNDFEMLDRVLARQEKEANECCGGEE